MVDQTSTLQKDARVRSGRGKLIGCAVLSASLAAAVEARERCHVAESQMVESLQKLVQSLQGQVAELKNSLKKRETR